MGKCFPIKKKIKNAFLWFCTYLLLTFAPNLKSEI